jgi:guanine deaminase
MLIIVCQVTLRDINRGEGIGALDFFEDAIPESLTNTMVEKWWCIGDDRNRRSVWVQGKKVYS